MRFIRLWDCVRSTLGRASSRIGDLRDSFVEVGVSVAEMEHEFDCPALRVDLKINLRVETRKKKHHAALWVVRISPRLIIDHNEVVPLAYDSNRVSLRKPITSNVLVNYPGV